MFPAIIFGILVLGATFVAFIMTRLVGRKNMRDSHFTILVFWPILFFPWLGMTYGDYCYRKQMDRTAIIDQVKKELGLK